MPHLETVHPLESPEPQAPRQGAARLSVGGLSRLPIVQAFSRFMGVGVVGLGVDAAIFSLLDIQHVAPEWSRAISLFVATLVTWRLNRSHTFAASGRHPAAEAMRYGMVTLVAQGFSYGVFLALVYGAPVLPRLLSLLVGAGLAALVGFTGHKLFAFAPARRAAGALSATTPTGS